VKHSAASTAADLIKIAMLRLDAELRERGLEAKMLLQVHDELCWRLRWPRRKP